MSVIFNGREFVAIEARRLKILASDAPVAVLSFERSRSRAKSTATPVKASLMLVAHVQLLARVLALILSK
jgi:hypothetical protein